MELKILLVVVVASFFVAYLIIWAKWFAEMYKAKKKFDELDKQTLGLMAQAFKETRQLQSDIDYAANRTGRR